MMHIDQTACCHRSHCCPINSRTGVIAVRPNAASVARNSPASNDRALQIRNRLRDHLEYRLFDSWYSRLSADFLPGTNSCTGSRMAKCSS